MTPIVCVAGFGDNASMFEPLQKTELANTHTLIGLNLPGFGAPPSEAPATLRAFADILHEAVLRAEAHFVMAHSVASLIAVLAAQKQGSPIELILSLEGNLTPEDAYFSGTAAGYSNAGEFKTAFLERLEVLAETGGPEITRYREIVSLADPRTLWELGCDAHAYSSEHIPGDELVSACRAVYFFNSANLPDASLRWLSNHTLDRRELPGASHWPTIDQPTELSSAILSAL